MMRTGFRRSDFLLLGGIFTCLVFYLIGERLFSSAPVTTATIFYSRFVFWGLVLVLFLYARIIEKNDFFIWKDRQYKFWYSIASVIVLYLLCLAFGFIAL